MGLSSRCPELQRGNLGGTLSGRVEVLSTIYRRLQVTMGLVKERTSFAAEDEDGVFDVGICLGSVCLCHAVEVGVARC